MKESTSWLTPKQAAKLAEVTTRTINNYITSGKLSASREDGRYYIDKSEFYRVFPHLFLKENISQLENLKETTVQKASEIEIQYLKSSLTEKEGQNNYLKEIIQSFTLEKNIMLNTINNHSRLLEYQQKSWLNRLIPWKKG